MIRREDRTLNKEIPTGRKKRQKPRMGYSLAWGKGIWQTKVG